MFKLIFKVEKLAAQTYFEKKFQNRELEWKYTYTLPGRVTINRNLRIFRYKLLHNISHLNEMLYKFGKKASQPFPETAIHLFYSLDAATAFFPKCTNNLSNYTTEHHLWIY